MDVIDQAMLKIARDYADWFDRQLSAEGRARAAWNVASTESEGPES